MKSKNGNMKETLIVNEKEYTLLSLFCKEISVRPTIFKNRLKHFDNVPLDLIINVSGTEYISPDGVNFKSYKRYINKYDNLVPENYLTLKEYSNKYQIPYNILYQNIKYMTCDFLLYTIGAKKFIYDKEYIKVFSRDKKTAVWNMIKYRPC